MNYVTKVDEKGQLRVWAKNAWRKAEYRECWWCGQPFAYRIDRTPRTDRNEGRFCSLSCSSRYKGKQFKIKGRVNVRCVICKTTIRRQKSQALIRTTCGNPYCVSKRRTQTLKARYNV